MSNQSEVYPIWRSYFIVRISTCFVIRNPVVKTNRTITIVSFRLTQILIFVRNSEEIDIKKFNSIITFSQNFLLTREAVDHVCPVRIICCSVLAKFLEN